MMLWHILTSLENSSVFPWPSTWWILLRQDFCVRYNNYRHDIQLISYLIKQYQKHSFILYVCFKHIKNTKKLCFVSFKLLKNMDNVCHVTVRYFVKFILLYLYMFNQITVAVLTACNLPTYGYFNNKHDSWW